jgi:predicted amidohydrolase
MEVLASDVERIPAASLNVPLDQFVTVWQTAEELDAAGEGGWYATGVVETCRWLGHAVVEGPGGRRELAYSPVTNTTQMAIEELIEAECVRAEVLAMRRPIPSWLQRRPGWIDGVSATLNWAWQRRGPAPIEDVSASG